MGRALPLAAAVLAAVVACAAPAVAEGLPRRLAHRPMAEALPPDIPYRDPRPRFRAPRPAAATFVVPAYIPRPTNQPMFNEPPQPLR